MDDPVALEVKRMKRRSFRKPLVLAGALALGFALCAFVTAQPVLTRSRSTSVVPSGTAARLEADVRALVSHARDEAHPLELEATRARIHAALEESGGAVEDQRYDVRGTSFANVIARYGPVDGERIVVGAHYDTCGNEPGADDDASGVAGLLEIARRLGSEPPPLRVDLVAFTLEEPPHFATESMGSYVHAASLAREGKAVRAMISLEMIGTFSDDPGSQRFPSSLLGVLYPDRGDFVAIVGDWDQAGLVRSMKRAMLESSPLPVRSINAPRTLPGIDFSDHRSYWTFGFPAVMVTDTAFFRNPRYHTAGDTPERLDYARMAEVVEATLGAVRALAARPR